MLLPWLAMCQPVFVEIIYMLPNWSEHKANCLTVKADCMFTVWPSALLMLAYLYHSEARDQYHFVWRDTNEGHTRLKCLDCLSLLIEASRFPPTELFVIKGLFIVSSKLKLKGRWKKDWHWSLCIACKMMMNERRGWTVSPNHASISDTGCQNFTPNYHHVYKF